MERGVRTLVRFNTRQITVIGMLSAITIVLGATGLGFIPLPAIKATILHVPVIIGAMIEGPVVGAMIGLIFGIFSIVQAITAPTVTSFMFLNPIVAVLPRILIGITSYYCYKAVRTKFDTFNMAIGAAIGSLTNTVGVLSMIYLIYLGPFAKALHISEGAAKTLIYGTALTSGLPEAAVSLIITVAVVSAVKKVRKR